MAVLIAMELFALLFAMNTLSSVRSFVTGESLWSKSQKDAVISLHKYARTQDIRYYKAFKEHLRTPLAFRQARLALEKDPSDKESARQFMLDGGIHPDDVLGLVQLIIRYQHFSYIKKAVKIWQEGDSLSDELILNAEQLHGLIKSRASQSQIIYKLNAIDYLNDRLTNLESHFSHILGEASRWLENLLMWTLVLAVLLVEGCGLLLTISFGQTLSKGLGQLSKAANEVGRGHFDVYVPIPSGDELGQLAESINNMAAQLTLILGEKAQAQEANLQKSAFLTNMSHEFRTPLTAIIGFSELLKDPETVAEDRKLYAETIHRTGVHLTNLINDILDLSKVESGHLAIEKACFSPKAMIQDLELVVKTKAQEKNLQILFTEQGPLPELVNTDPMRLRQILTHLLNNAIKFTGSGTVEFFYCEKEGFMSFEISDTGPGISWEKKQSLFQNFSLGDSSLSRKHEGAGLGLVLSKKLAQLLGGDVRLVKSSLGKGSTFAVQIPVDSSVKKPKRLREDLDSPALLASKSILVVDDVEENRLLIHRILSKKGAKLTLATNGEEGLSKALTENYDLILMDIQMPIMDGYTATRRLRQAGYHKPIIALTAHAMKDDRERCLAAGCTGYLTKPVHVETLVEMILNYTDDDVV